LRTKINVDPSVQKLIDGKIVTILRGKVIDETTAAPLNAIVTLVDNENGKVLSKIYSDPTTGDFELHIHTVVTMVLRQKVSVTCLTPSTLIFQNLPNTRRWTHTLSW